jgi:NAD(P)-dependent dehydrogenase (short-subunit alcohol dehydrogenase family)
MQDVMSLEGKTIVVTGAAQGIGQAIAGLAIGIGARVIGVDLKRPLATSRRASASLTAWSTMPALQGPR